MLKQPKTYRIKAVAMAVAFACLPVSATAAGLGRITVSSALGQPLRAELEVTATSDELNSLSAKIASADAFRSAGIEYVPVLSSLRFSRDVVERDGKRFIQISTDRPLNEPFVDMLVELSWASGRLVREFTFLLDPPRATITAPVPIAAPEVKAQPVVPAAPARPAAAAPARVVPPATSVPSASRAASGEKTRVVKPGDTLRAIAHETAPGGVSLDQMLVALFRSNAEAFDGNMNRMRAGKILSIPDADAARAVTPTDARREVMAQAADFNAYRRQLAGAAAAQPASDVVDSRASSGRIAPRVAAAPPPSPSGKDKLEVSRSDASGKADPSPQLQSRLAALEEDLVARDRALREANARIAQLEKNLADLKQLAALKSEAGAAMQAKAEAAKPSAPPPPVAAPPAAVAQAAPPSPPAAPVVEPPKATPAPAVDAGKPEVASAPPAPAQEAAPKPQPPKKKSAPPPPPPPEPDFLEENGPLVFGGAGVLAALLGYLGFSAYRKKKQAASAQAEPAISQEELSRSSVFSEAAAASVAEPEAPASEFSISEPMPDADSAAVDPIVEAETYLAFGRDSQAEEILLDALKADPTRLPVQFKLLDIYSARRSAMQFNTLAKELKIQTGGAGPDWDRVVALGSALDPDNPLYTGGEAIPVPAPEPNRFDMESTMVFNAPPPTDAAPAAEATQPPAEEVAALDFDLDLGAAEQPVETPPAEPAAGTSPDMALDFDLGLDSAPASAEPASEPVADAANLLEIDLDLAPETSSGTAESPAVADLASEIPALDLDLGGDTGTQAAPVAEQTASTGPAIDFSLDMELPAVGSDVAAPMAAEPAQAAPATDAIDFDFDLGDLPPASATAMAVPAASEMPGLDLDLGLEAAPAAEAGGADASTVALDANLPSLDLELGDAALVSADAEATALSLDVAGEEGAADVAGEDNPEAATKLELAAAYEEMGDRDGARELLEEVLNEGSAAQRGVARERLDALG